MNVPFFSICIVTYNAETSIRRTLDSIAYQTFTNYEVVIVNDGSTDNTKNIIYEFHKDNYKIINFDNNKGTISARIESMKQSSGKYIIFLDSDDYFTDSNSLMILYNNIINNNLPDICIADAWIKNHGKHNIEELLQGINLFEFYLNKFNSLYGNAYSNRIIQKVLSRVVDIECRYNEAIYLNYIIFSICDTYSICKERICTFDISISRVTYPKDYSYDSMIERYRSLSVAHREILRYCDKYYPEYRNETINKLKSIFKVLNSIYKNTLVNMVAI